MPMNSAITRAGFLAGSGTFLLAPGSAFAASEEDEALVRLAASAELLTIPFFYRAAASRHFTAAERKQLRDARVADGHHYRLLAEAIGVEPPVSQDFDISFARRAFATRAATLALGRRLVGTTLGLYVHLGSALQDSRFRGLAAQICASEATHASLVSVLSGRSALGPALPGPLNEEQATRILSPYWG
jgi:hypothetical protein